MKAITLALASATLLLAIGAANAQAPAPGDAAAGETVFKKCMACHAVGENAKNRVGPVLNGVVGRQAGTYPGYKYSPAMIKAGEEGNNWTPEHLASYLHAPKEFIPGNKMAFVGLKNDADIANVIAYLLTFSPDYVPADPAAAPAAPAQ